MPEAAPAEAPAEERAEERVVDEPEPTEEEREPVGLGLSADPAADADEGTM